MATLDVFAEIKTELKKKDDEFVRTLKKQAEDIDTLLQYMSRQFVEMQNAYKDEMNEIESAFLAVSGSTCKSTLWFEFVCRGPCWLISWLTCISTSKPSSLVVHPGAKRDFQL